MFFLSFILERTFSMTTLCNFPQLDTCRNIDKHGLSQNELNYKQLIKKKHMFITYVCVLIYASFGSHIYFHNVRDSETDIKRRYAQGTFATMPSIMHVHVKNVHLFQRKKFHSLRKMFAICIIKLRVRAPLYVYMRRGTCMNTRRQKNKRFLLDVNAKMSYSPLCNGVDPSRAELRIFSYKKVFVIQILAFTIQTHGPRW